MWEWLGLCRRSPSDAENPGAPEKAAQGLLRKHRQGAGCSALQPALLARRLPGADGRRYALWGTVLGHGIHPAVLLLS